MPGVTTRRGPPFRATSYGVARYQTRRRLARDRQFVTLDADADTHTVRITEDDLTSTLERRHALQRLRRAILSLPRKYREVIVLCDLQDVSYSDAGCRTGMRRRHYSVAPSSRQACC